jgi:hypothetical protein
MVMLNISRISDRCRPIRVSYRLRQNTSLSQGDADSGGWLEELHKTEEPPQSVWVSRTTHMAITAMLNISRIHERCGPIHIRY